MSATDCGLPPALSVTVMVPVLVPDDVGENVTLTVQLAPTASDELQVLVWPKSPVAAMLVILRFVVPPFLTVTVCAALVLLKASVEKFRVLALKHTAGAARLFKRVTKASNPPPVAP